MIQPVDSSILREVARIIQSTHKVPDKVVIKSKEYQVTYLDDHQRRMEEALQRRDNDRLNMLFGQLTSKIKYQQMRRAPSRRAQPEPAQPAANSAKAAPKGPKRASRQGAKTTQTKAATGGRAAAKGRTAAKRRK